MSLYTCKLCYDCKDVSKEEFIQHLKDKHMEEIHSKYALIHSFKDGK